MSELKHRKNTKVLKPPNVKSRRESKTNIENESKSSSSLCSCSSIGKCLLFIIVVPPMLNYASLRQERDFLTTNTTQYDVGFGQKLHLSCAGEGAPTVILDAPTGLTSDSWLAGMSELSTLTRVCVYDRQCSPLSLVELTPGAALIG